MGKFILIIIIIAIIAIWGYNWWKNNSSRLATEEINRFARNMVDNPEELKVTVTGVKIISKNNASIDKVGITGQNILLKNSIKLSSFVLNINNAAFTIPIISKISSVKSGNFEADISENAITEYLRKKNINIVFWKINADNVKVDIKKNNKMQILLPVVIPVISKTSMVIVDGYLKCDNNINFIPEKLSISGMKLSSDQSSQLLKAIDVINPIVKFDKIPFAFKPKLLSSDTDISLKGDITGIR